MTHEERMTRAAAYAAWQRIKKETEDERDALQAIVNRVLDVLQPLYALLPSKAKTLVDEIKEAVGK